MSVLSLGLLLPFGAGAFPDRAIALLTNAAGETPAKHVVLINGTARDTVETRTTTVDGFLRERGITLGPADALSSVPEAPIVDGSTILYRQAVPVSFVVDGMKRALVTSAANVGEALATARLTVGPHDTVKPAAASALVTDMVIEVTHATSWLERVRTAIAPTVVRKYDVGMTLGTRRIVDPGSSGTKETTVEVLAPNSSADAKRLVLAERILRLPRPKVVAEGVGDGSTLAQIARRGIIGTARLADAALKMVATAYTAGCSGCSGLTATGRPAGHGIVAVDPQFIPLGTHLFIPGYGHAFAGDTGGAIRGNRIDLGFDSHRDAMSFGRRQIVVYVLKNHDR